MESRGRRGADLLTCDRDLKLAKLFSANELLDFYHFSVTSETQTCKLHSFLHSWKVVIFVLLILICFGAHIFKRLQTSMIPPQHLFVCFLEIRNLADLSP